jgi:hypothetical protein
MGYLFDSSSPYMLWVPGLVPGTADQAFVESVLMIEPLA